MLGAKPTGTQLAGGRGLQGSPLFQCRLWEGDTSSQRWCGAASLLSQRSPRRDGGGPILRAGRGFWVWLKLRCRIWGAVGQFGATGWFADFNKRDVQLLTHRGGLSNRWLEERKRYFINVLLLILGRFVVWLGLFWGDRGRMRVCDGEVE